MPRKDREARLAYQREWYAKNRKRVIAKVTKRKKERYAGECLNCGDTTWGLDPKHIAQYCGKPECRSVQLKRRHLQQVLGLEPTPGAHHDSWEKRKHRHKKKGQP